MATPLPSGSSETSPGLVPKSLLEAGSEVTPDFTLLGGVTRGLLLQICYFQALLYTICISFHKIDLRLWPQLKERPSGSLMKQLHSGHAAN